MNLRPYKAKIICYTAAAAITSIAPQESPHYQITP